MKRACVPQFALAAHEELVRSLIEEQPDITPADLKARLAILQACSKIVGLSASMWSDDTGTLPVVIAATAAERRFAVRGTPTDCVIMGARHLLSGKGLDLVLSGVNRGSNVGEDVIYSGTVAGAVEGTVLGIPSIALSQAYKSRSGGKPIGRPVYTLLPTSFAA